MYGCVVCCVGRQALWTLTLSSFLQHTPGGGLKEAQALRRKLMASFDRWVSGVESTDTLQEACTALNLRDGGRGPSYSTAQGPLWLIG
jgi:hypothetical protein